MTCYYAGDFETTTNKDETEVWLSCFARVIDYDRLDTFKVNTSIEDFLKALYLDLDTLKQARMTISFSFITSNLTGLSCYHSFLTMI